MNPLDNVGTASGGNFQLGGGMDSLYKQATAPPQIAPSSGKPMQFSNIQGNPGAQNFLKHAAGSSLNPNPQASPWNTPNPQTDINPMLKWIMSNGYDQTQAAEIMKGQGF